MRLSGHNSVGEAMRALPQNFNGGQNPGVAPGASNVGGIANQNVSGGSGINLRGLGPDATVTLLTGSRLPYDGFRSEEHTSELQSLMRISYAVFCLTKKNKQKN